MLPITFVCAVSIFYYTGGYRFEQSLQLIYIFVSKFSKSHFGKTHEFLPHKKNEVSLASLCTFVVMNVSSRKD